MVKDSRGINISGVIQFQSGNLYSRLLDQNQLGVDLGLEKEFKITNFRMTFSANAFNLFDSGVADQVETTTDHSSRPFGLMRSITDPFYLRIRPKGQLFFRLRR